MQTSPSRRRGPWAAAWAGSIGWLGVALTGAACGPGMPEGTLQAPSYEPESMTKCSVAKSQRKPLIVEWPSAERLTLETLAKRSLVAVRYSGCEMEVLSHCRVPGSYGYLAATRQDDELRITNEDELYANIPVYAAKFEAKLQSAGQLNVSMSMVGRYLADRARYELDELEGSCDGATHVIAGLTVGAFEFSAGASAAGGAGLEAGPVGSGLRKASAREMLNRAGDRSACDGATDRDERPPSGCGALIRVEVVPIEGAEPRRTASPTESPATTSGDSRDTDGDGFADRVDRCPHEAGTDAGCPGSSSCTPGKRNCRSDADCCPDEQCDDCPVARWMVVTPLFAQDACPPPKCVPR